jgi:hypothetical protein
MDDIWANKTGKEKKKEDLTQKTVKTKKWAKQ